jgi:hypothetical protein
VSIPVEIRELADTLVGFGAGYLLTADAEGQVKVVSVVPRLVGGRLVCAPSRGSARNLADNPHATVLFPPYREGGMSLLVDGTAVAGDDGISVTPTSAVLHRPAAS